MFVKYNICLKILLQHVIPETVFYGDLVYKFKIIVGKPSFSDELKKTINIIKGWDTTCISCDSLQARL